MIALHQFSPTALPQGGATGGHDREADEKQHNQDVPFTHGQGGFVFDRSGGGLCLKRHCRWDDTGGEGRICLRREGGGEKRRRTDA